MTFFRAIYRLALLLLWSALLAAMTAPYQLRPGWKSTKKIINLAQIWNKGVARIIGLRVKLYGSLPNRSGGLLVSNHLSYVDIVAQGAVLPVRHSPKADIAKWPILGWYIGLSRPIWINRNSKQASKKALRDFVKTMKHGLYLIVYPEGTSSDGKNGVLPFKSTPFESAIIGNVPIIPILVRYNETSGSRTVCWYGDMTLLPHAWRVLGRASIDVELHFLKPIFPENRPRKELASLVHNTMSREYAKIV